MRQGGGSFHLPYFSRVEHVGEGEIKIGPIVAILSLVKLR